MLDLDAILAKAATWRGTERCRCEGRGCSRCDGDGYVYTGAENIVIDLVEEVRSLRKQLSEIEEW